MTKNEFIKSFVGLCSVFNREPTKFLIDTYYLVLKDLTANEFNDAIVSILSSRKYTNFPIPAEILEAVYGSAEDMAIIALKELEDAIERYGGYNSVIFNNKVTMACVEAMGGWQKVCETTTKERESFKREFLRLYEAYYKMPEKMPKVRYLVGKIEHQNRIKGFDEDIPVYCIGYPKEQNPYEILPLSLVRKALQEEEAKEVNKVQALIANSKFVKNAKTVLPMRSQQLSC